MACAKTAGIPLPPVPSRRFGEKPVLRLVRVRAGPALARPAGPCRSGSRPGYRVPHERAETGGRPLCPADGGAHPGPELRPGPRLPLRSGLSVYPAPSFHRAVPARNEASTRVRMCSPVRSSEACGHPDATARSWANSASFARRRPGVSDVRRGGDRPSSADPALQAQHTSVDLRFGRFLVSADLASHVAKRPPRCGRR